jgi:transposase
MLVGITTSNNPRGPAMLIKTLLNWVHPVKGFVYQKTRMVNDPGKPNGKRLDIWLRPRRGSRGVCSSCGRRGPTYDTQSPPRRFEFVPLWNVAVFFLYAMRRIDCPHCGVKVERVPWATDHAKSPLTRAYASFLATWAQRLSWSEVAAAFSVHWQTVYQAVQSVVQYGLAHRDLSTITAIGVDEVAYKKGHRYATLVYQINGANRRLLHVAEGRTAKSLLSFFVMLRREGRKRQQNLIEPIRFVCSDMWQAYRKVITKMLPHALHILDRYHLVAMLNKALDQVRAEQARKLSEEGWDVLKKSRWLLLRRRKRLDGKKRYKLREILKHNLRTVRAYILKESLMGLWEYKSPTYAGRYLDAWCRSAMYSKIDPIKKVASSLRKHRPLILNWFHAKRQYNSGIVEGMNLNVKLRFRKAYGFRTFDAIQVALYHELGNLPPPPATHRFA